MIMITAIIYTFLSYAIFHQQMKITFRKSSSPLKKSIPPFYSLSPLKIKKCKSPLFANTDIFSAHLLPLQKEGLKSIENV